MNCVKPFLIAVLVYTSYYAFILGFTSKCKMSINLWPLVDAYEAELAKKKIQTNAADGTLLGMCIKILICV